MPKTIAITPSWYWPERVDRVAGIPPYAVHELCVERHARRHPERVAVIGATQTLSFGELQEKVRQAAGAVRAQAAGAGTVVLQNENSADNVVSLLGALTAGVRIRIVGGSEDASTIAAQGGTPRSPGDFDKGAITIPGKRGPVNHSHRSLLAMAVSLTTFLDPLPDSPWFSTLTLDRWEGLVAALIPLYRGTPLVTGWGMDVETMLEQIGHHQPAFAVFEFDAAVAATRDSRRGIRSARDVLTGMILATTHAFDPGDRQRVAKTFRCPALTLYGLAETGPVFASHPQWYIDESVGIPVTNAHVVPADPRNGAPIHALWEQVESAEVTVKGPMLMCHETEDDSTATRFVDGRYRTGVIASSDANGMIYLLPE